MNKDILVCGVGGQGTVLASKLIAAAAMEDGNIVHSAETIGMAQRGGPVTSHIRIGSQAFSPLVPRGSADLILAFEPGEAVRNLAYLKRDGMMIVNSVPVKPVSESLHDTGYDGTQMLTYLKEKCENLVIDAQTLCAPFGSSRYFNVVVLGAAAGTGRLGIRLDAIVKELEIQVPRRFIEQNKQALMAGWEAGKHYAAK